MASDRSFSHTCLLVLASLAPFAAAACVSNPEPKSAIALHRDGHGTKRIYDVSFDDAWKAAHIALHWDKAGTPEDHLDQRFVVTNHPSSDAPSFLEQVGVWLEPMNANKTRVSVVVMSGADTEAGRVGPDEDTVQKDIAKAIAIVQTGQAVPEKKPE
jgi:hypothetical protein